MLKGSGCPGENGGSCMMTLLLIVIVCLEIFWVILFAAINGSPHSMGWERFFTTYPCQCSLWPSLQKVVMTAPIGSRDVAPSAWLGILSSGSRGIILSFSLVHSA